MKTPTDNELNLAMCKWMGWRWVEGVIVPRLSYVGAVACADCWRRPDGSAGTGDYEPPNYLSDDSPRRLLNEAEAWLIDMVAYRINLSKIVGIGYAPDLDICDDIRAFVSATARQRVIAMLQIVKPELFH